MSRVVAYPDMEVCPSCGRFVKALTLYTGWCLTCESGYVTSHPRDCVECGGIVAAGRRSAYCSTLCAQKARKRTGRQRRRANRLLERDIGAQL